MLEIIRVLDSRLRGNDDTGRGTMILGRGMTIKERGTIILGRDMTIMGTRSDDSTLGGRDMSGLCVILVSAGMTLGLWKMTVDLRGVATFAW